MGSNSSVLAQYTELCLPFINKIYRYRWFHLLMSREYTWHDLHELRIGLFLKTNKQIYNFML